MATTKARTAAKRTVKKAQETQHSMSSRADARARPEGHKRRKPGATGGGEFFHIEVRPREEFETFRTQDVGQRRGIERVAGRRATGFWPDRGRTCQKSISQRLHRSTLGTRT